MGELNKWFLTLEPKLQKLLTNDKWHLANAVWDFQDQKITELEQQNRKLKQDLKDTESCISRREAVISDYEQQVAELKASNDQQIEVMQKMREDLLERGQIASDGSRIVNVSSGTWSKFCDTLEASPQTSLAEHNAKVTEPIAQLIHYPECWDTMTYPTLESAISEIAHCTTCESLRQDKDES